MKERKKERERENERTKERKEIHKYGKVRQRGGRD